MRDETFQTKQHLAKHLTLNRYGIIEEVSEINSAEEMDFLEWKLFLARVLTPETITPFIQKQIVLATDKYRKQHKSYAFGPIQKIKAKWLLLLIGAIVGVVLLLYFTGNLDVVK